MDRELSIQEVVEWIQQQTCPHRLDLLRNTVETRRHEVAHNNEWGASGKSPGQPVTVPGARAQP